MAFYVGMFLLVAFVDDLAEVVTVRTFGEVNIHVNQALGDLVKWLKARSLMVSPQKIEILLMMGRRWIPRFAITLEGMDATSLRRVKYLGVWLSETRGFTTHIMEVCRKVERVSSAVVRLMMNVGGPKP